MNFSESHQDEYLYQWGFNKCAKACVCPCPWAVTTWVWPLSRWPWTLTPWATAPPLTSWVAEAAVWPGWLGTASCKYTLCPSPETKERYRESELNLPIITLFFYIFELKYSKSLKEILTVRAWIKKSVSIKNYNKNHCFPKNNQNVWWIKFDNKFILSTYYLFDNLQLLQKNLYNLVVVI